LAGCVFALSIPVENPRTPRISSFLIEGSGDMASIDVFSPMLAKALEPEPEPVFTGGMVGDSYGGRRPAKLYTGCA
jgi:hypothetical protein